jgi:N-acetylneuraminic acid mutarotase
MKTNRTPRDPLGHTETFAIGLNMFWRASYFVIIVAAALCPSMALAQGDTWIKKANMPTPRLGLATCVVNGKIYAVGGYAAAGASGIKTVEEYDPITDSWTAKAPMPTARERLSCAAVDGKFYAIGGSRAFLSGPLKTVEEYDPATDTWTGKSDMSTARSDHAVAVVNGKIYVMGGATAFGAPGLSTVEAYDAKAGTWERKANMPTPRGFFCASVVDGKIFAIGSAMPLGATLTVVEMYDPQTDTWTRKASMPTPRGEMACSTAHGRIYVMGGRDCCSSFVAVEEYDPFTDTWIKRANMWTTNPVSPTRRWAFSASEVNGRIYAIGGALDIAEPHPGVSLVLEYTPPVTAPALKVTRVNNAEQNVLRTEWKSRVDCFDLLQTQNQLQTNGWTDVERFSGTGETVTKEFPTVGRSGFYRLRRELQ